MRIHMVFQKKITHSSWQNYSTRLWACGYDVYYVWFSWPIFLAFHRVRNEKFEKFSYLFSMCTFVRQSSRVSAPKKLRSVKSTHISYWRITVNFISTFRFWISWKKAGENRHFRYAADTVRGSIPGGGGRDFPHLSRSALEPIQPPVQ